MTGKQRLIGTAAAAALLVAGASFALAEGAPRSIGVRNGVAATAAPMHPIVWDGLRGVNGPVLSQLTSSECTGLGGTVNDVPKAKCTSGKGCVTAGTDGVLHGVCIDEKVN